MQTSGGAVSRIRPVLLLAEGGEGEVFIGLDGVLRRRVVVKKIVSSSFESAAARESLLAGARTLTRLDHPGIARIFDYSERDGRDVFVIEYVEGTPLADWSGDFGGKVRVAITIAAVLAEVHRNDLVHGALSPASIVVGESGQAKVIDFAPTSTELNRPHAEARWRSPEQGRGEAVTRASDMYAFGLVLREMFGSGDGDVDALVASLLREAPAERTTARTALARLERLARRTARRIRQAAAVVIICGLVLGTVKYTVDLRRERDVVSRARAESESRRARANALVGFMLDDLRTKLDSVGRLDVLDAATAKALAYFGSMKPEELSVVEASSYAQALLHLGQTQIARSEMAAARQTVLRALRIAEATLRREPQAFEIRLAVARAHLMLGNVYAREGDGEAALAHTLTHTTIMGELVRQKPRDLPLRMLEASAHSNLGSIYDRREDIVGCLRELEIAISLQRDLLAARDSDEMRFDIGITAHKTGLALLRAGRLADARRWLEREHAEVESLLERNPAHKRVLYLKEVFHDDLFTVSLALGDGAGAQRHARAHLELGRELASLDTDNLEWAQQLAAAYRSNGSLARMRGDTATALRHHQQAVKTLDAIATRGRLTHALMRELSMSRSELARSLLRAERASEAVTQAAGAVEVLSRGARDPSAARFLGDALLVQGEARAATGDAAGATASWLEALQVLEPLDARSADPRISDAHVRVLLLLGRTDEARPRIDELFALGYRNREFEALCREKGALINAV